MRHLLVVLPFALLFAATPTRAEDASPYDVRTGVNVQFDLCRTSAHAR